MAREVFIKPFEEITKNDAAIAGGKGASLGEMTRADISVPPGFVILARAFDHFLAHNDLVQEIDAILHGVHTEDMRSVEHASEQIAALVCNGTISSEMEKDILSHFAELDAVYVAVRSSATAEDSSSAAWAGQLNTYLNTTKKELLQNVKKCWASLYTPRAIFYRFEKNLHKDHISVAVVVQKMVQSEISGIAFSVHPVTEDHNQLIIEAGYGLGEAIVSGQITPDAYVVEKEPRNILDVNIADQERGLYRAAQGNNAWKEIPHALREKQKLTGQQILALADLVVAIENHYGHPQDIEWAVEKNKFYITQSRPITTLRS